MQLGKQEGATLLMGGHMLQEGAYAQGFYFEPTIFTNVRPEMIIAQEEIFGPVISIIEVANLDEAIDVNNGVKFGLSSAIFSQDVNTIFKAQARLDTGIVYINAGTTGAEIHLPFGGTKGTGNGHRDSGQAALDVYTEWKSIYVDYSGKLNPPGGIPRVCRDHRGHAQRLYAQSWPVHCRSKPAGQQGLRNSILQ